jgi:hypothetical protein
MLRRLALQIRIATTAACLLLAFASAARAATFVVIRSGTDAWTVIDPGAVVRDPNSQRLSAWSVTVQRNLTNSVPPQPGYIRSLNEYDCAERRIRWRSFAAYSRFGSMVMKSDNAAVDWAPAPGGSEGDAGLRVLCDGVGGGAVVSAPSMTKLVLNLMQAWDAPVEQAVAPPRPAPAKPAGPKRGQPKRRHS